MPHCPIQMLADFFSLHPFPHLAQPFHRDHFIAFYFLIRNIFYYNITVEIIAKYIKIFNRINVKVNSRLIEINRTCLSILNVQ